MQGPIQKPLIIALACAISSAACILNFDGLSSQQAADAGEIPDAGQPNATACKGDHGPQQVRIQVGNKSFCIDSTEVTNSQYKEYYEDTDAEQSTNFGCSSTKSSPKNMNNDTYASYPVGNIDWCSAYSYCLWAGKHLCGRIDGKDYITADLNDPTASEWYAACAGSSSNAYPYGVEYKSGICVDSTFGGDAPRAVGTAKNCQVNGLFDLSGNLEEWTNECAEGACLARGGNYSDAPGSTKLGCAAKPSDPQSSYQDRAQAQDWIGFRCCSN